MTIYTHESDNRGTAEPYFYYIVSLVEDDDGRYYLTGESNDPRAILHEGDKMHLTRSAAVEWLKDHDTAQAVANSVWAGF